MPILLRDLVLDINKPESELHSAIVQHLRIGRERLQSYRIVKKSLDSRRGRKPGYHYTLELVIDTEVVEALMTRKRVPIERVEADPAISVPTQSAGARPPVVIGSGPAGLLAAYRLAQAGLQPIIIERGQEVTERSKTWHAFLQGGEFDCESNLLYGEGGAGTYSDGKLYTRVNDPRTREILDLFVACGAPAEVGYDAKPHIGSNLLPSVIRRLRERMMELGAEFRFSTRFKDLVIDNGHVRAITLSGGETLECDALFLATGHSARDTFKMLHQRGVAMERKAFQIGARIEHPQKLINQLQYGQYSSNKNLPPADYRFVQKRPDGDIFSFCMCPGGEILPAVEKPGFICVNGASRFKRIGDFANSGFVLTLDPSQFKGEDVFAGVEYQEQVEAKAAALAEHSFGAPALRLMDFIEGRISSDLPKSSYPLPLTAAPFQEFMPNHLFHALRDGLSALLERLPLLKDPEAIIVGPESRSSSPVRICRDRESLQSTSVQGLYPIGEGAGYAGGIMSAAMDGMICAERHMGMAVLSRSGGGAQ